MVVSVVNVKNVPTRQLESLKYIIMDQQNTSKLKLKNLVTWTVVLQQSALVKKDNSTEVITNTDYMHGEISDLIQCLSQDTNYM